MRIYPAVHYTMGGTWVDYNLMSTLPGLFVLGEANFSDHGANRLGASALMQGLADGYFVLPYTIGNYFATSKQPKPSTSHRGIQEGRGRRRGLHQPACSRSKASAPPTSLHRELGKLLWEKCGMARNEAGLKEALQAHSGTARGILEERQRHRRERRVEPEPRIRRARGGLHGVCRTALPGRAASPRILRRPFPRGIPDARRRGASATTRILLMWPPGNTRARTKPPVLHKEPLVYEEVHMSTRSYNE